MYNEKSENVKEKLKNTADYYSVTVDGWTSSATDSYLSLTCHWVSDSWILESKCLQVLLCTVYSKADLFFYAC